VRVEFVSTDNGSLLRAVRHTLTGAERVLICTAFVKEAGIHLISRELEALRTRRQQVRLLLTTTWGSTTSAAIERARALNVEVGVYNYGGGTFHPKVFLGIGERGRCRAVIGSANLTGGLAANVEAGLAVEGTLRDPVLRSAWEWAELRWGEPIVEYWRPEITPTLPRAEGLEPELQAAIEVARSADPVFLTLGPRPRRNIVTQVSADAVYVETDKSRAEHGGPEPVPATMFNLAWNHLRAHGRLSNTTLLNELRVMRSSAICAILARLPGVRRAGGGKIELVYNPQRPLLSRSKGT